jgi:hypothetical protein
MTAGTAGGFGVVVFVLAEISLRLAAASVVTVAGLTAVWAIGRLPALERSRALRLIRRGLASGALATVAYDLTRLALASALGIAPFEVWKLFGRLLVGEDAPGGVVLVAGTAYHLANGLGFAIAFIVFVRRPTWWKGVLFALVLEAAMAVLYPRWLRMQQLAEFYTVSMLGHLAYGSVLGSAARRLMAKARPVARRSE